LSGLLGDKAQSLSSFPKLPGLGALMAKRKTNIECFSDEETSGTANENCPEFRQKQPRGADTIARQRQGSPGPVLSEPEAQVLLSLLAGKQSSQIAGDIEGGTLAVKEHIKSMLRKIRGH
jgi:DNA-binding CsgD family transcriptional regulator